MTVLDLERLSIELAGLVTQGNWEEARKVAGRIEWLAGEIRKKAEKAAKEVEYKTAAGP